MRIMEKDDGNVKCKIINVKCKSSSILSIAETNHPVFPFTFYILHFRFYISTVNLINKINPRQRNRPADSEKYGELFIKYD